MNKENFKPLADELQSSDEVILAIAHLLRIRGSDVTKKTIRTMWENPTSEQRELIKKRAMLFALANGLEDGDELCWGEESFVIIEKIEVARNQIGYDDFEQLADELQSSDEVVHAIAYVLRIQGSGATEENIVAMWGDPNSEQRYWIKKQAMLFALDNGLENGYDELRWGEESFVIIKKMEFDDFKQLARSLESNDEVVHAIAYVLEIEGSYVTEENIMAMWQDPTSEQSELIEKKAMLLALENGLETGDELFWGEETFVITI